MAKTGATKPVPIILIDWEYMRTRIVVTRTEDPTSSPHRAGRSVTLIPVSGLVIAGLTVAAVFGGAWLAVKATEILVEVRDSLRARYFRDAREWHAVDTLGFPAWLLAEALCLIVTLLWAALQIALVITVARDFRDWWHQKPNR